MKQDRLYIMALKEMTENKGTLKWFPSPARTRKADPEYAAMSKPIILKVNVFN